MSAISLSSLRLFSPEDQDHGAPPGRDQWKILDAYEALILPEMRANSSAKNTIAGDYTAIKHWNTRTANPRVLDIENRTLVDFRTKMLEGDPKAGLKPLATRTVSKTWATIRKILRRVGPPGYGNPQGEGITTRVAYMSPLHHARTRPRVVQPADVGAIYEGCSAATWPHVPGVPAPLFWRAAIVLWYFYGLRTQDLAAYTRAAGGLIWPEVRFTPESPDPDSRASNEWGWLDFTPQKTERTRGENLVLPLHEIARKHLDAIFSRDRQRVFPSAYCNKSYYAQWYAIQERAGIERPYDIGDLRKTCNNLWNRVSPGLGGWVLGHTPRGTNAQYYTVVEPQILDTLPLLPVPPAFLRGALGGRQLSLF